MANTETAKHTPGPCTHEAQRRSTAGPWHIEQQISEHGETPEGRIYVNGADTSMICVVPSFNVNQQTDARLIAAAPDLLAALKEIRNESYQHIGEIGRIKTEFGQGAMVTLLTFFAEDADAAIAKAETR